MWWLRDRPGRDGPVTIKRHGWATTDELFLRRLLNPSQIDLPRPPTKFDQRITRAWRKHATRDLQVLNLVAHDANDHCIIGKFKSKHGLADSFLALCWEKLEL